MFHPQDLEIYSDGGARGNPGPGASAFVVFDNKKQVFEKSKYLGITTNNIAEYFAVLLAIFWLSKNVVDLQTGKVKFFMDSELVVKQLSGKYKIKNQKLKAIYEKIINLVNTNGMLVDFNHIPRNKNKKADSLVNKEIDENL